MAVIIDRRLNDKGKSFNNRQRFLKRVEGQIRKAIPKIIDAENIKDIISGKGKISIPIKGIDEPTFIYDKDGGTKRNVHTGNKDYEEGDRVPKSRNSRGQKGRRGSDDPTVGEDEFTITISKDEFMEYFFQDLELPDMIKKSLKNEDDFKQKKAGFIQYGVPSRLNVIKSYQNSLSRRIATQSYLEKKLKKLQDKLLSDLTLSQEEKKQIENEIEKIKRQIKIIPFIDELDLRYNHFEKQPIPSVSAVMFMVMDISGSMGEEEKDICKRFFILLYLFLTKQYEKVEMVFIQHHTMAKEVSEDEFFNSRENGGTIVTPAIELMKKIINERYPNGYNVFCVQASDGDTFSEEDACESANILEKDILPNVQYMAYVQVMRPEMNDLWMSYARIEKKFENFVIEHVNHVSEIWSVFKGLFQKEN